MLDNETVTTVPSHGNAEQVRAVAEQLATSILGQIEQRGTIVDFATNEKFHKWFDERMDNRNRKMILQLALAYIVPIFIGGAVLYNKMDDVVVSNDENTSTLYARGQFVRDQQTFNCEVAGIIAQEHKIIVTPCRFDSADDPRDVRR